MKKLMELSALMAILALTAGRAEAQGRGTVNTPFGQFNANDMRASGGNPFAAEELREQKLMIQQQQQYMKQQQQYQKQLAQQQKARAEYLKKHPEAAKAAVTANKPVAKAMTKTAKAARKKAVAKAATEKSATVKKDEATNPKVAGAPADEPNP